MPCSGGAGCVHRQGLNRQSATFLLNHQEPRFCLSHCCRVGGLVPVLLPAGRKYSSIRVAAELCLACELAVGSNLCHPNSGCCAEHPGTPQTTKIFGSHMYEAGTCILKCHVSMVLITGRQAWSRSPVGLAREIRSLMPTLYLSTLYQACNSCSIREAGGTAK